MMSKGKIFSILILLCSVSNSVMIRANEVSPFKMDLDSLIVDSLVSIRAEAITDSVQLSSIYDMEYSLTANYPNRKQLIDNSKGIVGGMLMATGVMMMLPEDMTNWKDTKGKNVFERWFNNVKQGPVVDKDGFVVNYILHPYSGAVYYMTARSAGYNTWNSLLYVSFVSTFVWEFGLEAFAEPPSIQDLLTTPFIGALMGEGFYLAKRDIVARDYRVLSSRLLGKILVFLMDPVTEVMGLVFHTDKHTPDMEKWQVFCPVSNFVGQKTFLSFKLTF